MAVSSTFSPKYQSSRALIIGINKYAHCPPLAHAANDAKGIAKVLADRFSFGEVALLTDEEATRQAIFTKFHGLADLGNCDVEDRLLVFFAGHGHTVTGNRNEIGFLVPCDGQVSSISSLIRWDDLTRGAELIPAKHIFFIMDACFSGLALHRKIPPGSARYINDMMSRYSRQVLTAGKADETVSDGNGTRLGHSIFTSHVLDALDGAASLQPGVVTATGIMSYVHKQVGTDPYSKQTPHFGHVEGDGDFIFSGFDGASSRAAEGPDLPVRLSTPEAEEVPLGVAERMKDLVDDPALRIKLMDFVNGHLRVVATRLTPEEFSMTSPEDVSARIKRYEDAVSDLQVIVVLLAHWAEDRHHQVLQHIFARLTDLQTERSGLQQWLWLSWYPIVFLLYSAGIAALARNNFGALAQTLLAKVTDPSGSRNPTTPVAFLAMEKVTNLNDTFKRLPGYENKHVPRSEYLHVRLQPALEDQLFLGRSYDHLFDQFEILLTLFYAHHLKTTQNRVWGPPGRFAWKHSSHGEASPYLALVSEAKTLRQGWQPVAQGLFNGKPDEFGEIADAYRQLMERHPFF